MKNLHPNAALLLIPALACSGDNGPTQPTNTGNSSFTVNVVNNQFDPGAISVPLNSTVTWQWNSGGVEHNVTFQDGSPRATRAQAAFRGSSPRRGPSLISAPSMVPKA